MSHQACKHAAVRERNQQFARCLQLLSMDGGRAREREKRRARALGTARFAQRRSKPVVEGWRGSETRRCLEEMRELLPVVVSDGNPDVPPVDRLARAASQISNESCVFFSPISRPCSRSTWDLRPLRHGHDGWSAAKSRMPKLPPAAVAIVRNLQGLHSGSRYPV